ncbi:hypothetical protein GCM10010387_34600 [Streptomyces inusitatus]|uniref:DUF6777 domain-containing protein n=1 Tax=Streptomyces inusitatus TaxID=68221 RepID=A0A918UWA3_9ACTN|nr:DUF6777 domain-containing protein [Streptomyces inusitatus]GGZ37515.1 hypothetical protein GCM10010387_34600 [Streptomyces inusitatus]
MRSNRRRDTATRRRRYPERGRWPRLPEAPGRRPVVVAIAAGICLAPLLAGCGTDPAPAPPAGEEVILQPVAARGPDPYTESTARSLSAPEPRPPAPNAGTRGAPLRGQTLRTLSGGTPGLYGGVESVGSCDAERQLDLIGEDRGKERAFARASGVSPAGLAGFLRELTPVVLRTDTRVTAHGYRAGSDVARQAVLQAGTAVLVDPRGVPRVRCAGGNPLRPPVAVEGAVVHRGRPWAGYAPERIVVIEPSDRVAGHLVIADVLDSGWIDRATGSDGERDSRPEVLPPGDAPDNLYSYPPAESLSRTPAPAATAPTPPPVASVPRTAEPDPVPAPGDDLEQDEDPDVYLEEDLGEDLDLGPDEGSDVFAG